MAHEVFICYANQDRKIADEVYAALRSNGITCWMAPQDIMAGEDWDKAIMDAIPVCRIVVMIFSASSNDSPYCISEIRTAFELKKEILPILIDSTLPHGRIALYLGSKQWLYANTPPLQQHLKKLVDEVKRHLSQIKTREEASAREREKAKEVEPEVVAEPEVKKPPVKEKPRKPKVWLWVSIGIIIAVVIIGVVLKFTVFSGEPTTPEDGKETAIATANTSTTTPPASTPTATSPTPTEPKTTPPETTTLPDEYVAIYYLPTTFDKNEISSNEMFTVNLSGNFTCQKDIPYPVDGLVIIPKVIARNKSTGNEVTLITSNNITSDFVPLEQGETVSFMQSLLLQFPEEVETGNYSIYLNAVSVKVSIRGLWVDIEDLLKLEEQYLGMITYNG
ncbi:MAG: hypothetical protein A2Z70_01175 [Chloroflexi bacterium RBG_13_48_17]|nr:MAG: hypothetical protein A2Z70_01175 [Chloroflexi bacterium RBG_13_48_17]